MNASTPIEGRTPSQAPSAQNKKLAKACADFEALFLQQLFKQMRATVPRSDPSGGSQAETLYTEMLDGELAQSIARGRGIGLADLLYRQVVEKTQNH